MHPLVARIHPSYRTSILAWLITRFFCWMTARGQAGSVEALLPPLGDAGWASGAPLWAALVRACRALPHGPWVMTGLGELALLIGAVAVYRFARRDRLPHTAERATWLWLACPLMVTTLPVSVWTFAMSFAALGLAGVAAGRFVGASLALAIAIGLRPELVLLWPGVAWLGMTVYKPGKHASWSRFLIGLGPLAAFTAWVGSAMLLAGRWGVSLRTLSTGARWRTAYDPDLLLEQPSLMILAATCVTVLGLLLKNLKRTPKSWPVMIVPMLLWPFLHEPTFAAANILMCAIPAFVVLSEALEDRALERPVLVSFFGGLMLGW